MAHQAVLPPPRFPFSTSCPCHLLCFCPCPILVQDEKPFVSAKKVMGDLGAPYSDEVELASFHTVSKGVLGECGLRGGYVELTNFPPGTVDEMYKVGGGGTVAEG